ncbi:TetR/AcrR family transcriptional regulator [Pseudonocardia kongjuensis]|uniref:TetR/AcrR family transcriptional regulator n=1 Tax=Pseudonocardia kongjuensis TaxID=102227 RepID=A0ABN1XIG7_9PSEU
MRAPRSDARRSRHRILEAARTRNLADLRHNDLARAAGVGVATVYRHFPTVQALVEALARDALEQLDTACAEAMATSDPWEALAGLVDQALDLQLRNDGVQDVLVREAGHTPEVREIITAILDRYDAVLRRAHEAGVVHRSVTAHRLKHLMCGVEHAIRLGVPEDRPALQAALLRGIRRAG